MLRDHLLEHPLGYLADEVLQRPHERPVEVDRHADPEPRRRAIVRGVPGVAMPDDQRAGLAFNGDSLVVLGQDGFAANRCAPVLVTARYDRRGAVFPGEIRQQVRALGSIGLRRKR